MHAAFDTATQLGANHEARIGIDETRRGIGLQDKHSFFKRNEVLFLLDQTEQMATQFVPEDHIRRVFARIP